MPRKTKLANNEELVQDLMRYSPFGALSQMIVVTAIREYVKKVVETPPVDIDTGLINKNGFIGCCKDIKERCDDFYAKGG